jgi:DNA (cytosine-5)-methyltransferase 1
VLLENVRGLLTCEGGACLQAILGELSHAGYAVGCCLVNSKKFVPQHRERLYIVGIRQDLPGKDTFRFPFIPDLKPTVASILQTPSELSADWERALRVADATAGVTLPAGPPTRPYSLTEEQWNRVSASAYHKRHPKIVKLDGVSSTIRASYHSGWKLHSMFVAQEADGTEEEEPSLNSWDLHADEENSTEGLSGEQASKKEIPPPRFFSPRECARLQGFPDSFLFGDIPDAPMYSLIGNAVTVPVVTAIASALLCALQHPSEGCGDAATCTNTRI